MRTNFFYLFSSLIIVVFGSHLRPRSFSCHFVAVFAHTSCVAVEDSILTLSALYQSLALFHLLAAGPSCLPVEDSILTLFALYCLLDFVSFAFLFVCWCVKIFPCFFFFFFCFLATFYVRPRFVFVIVLTFRLYFSVLFSLPSYRVLLILM